MRALFISVGTVADSSDRLIMRVRVGAMTLIFAFSSDVGSGSRQHCLLGHVCTSRQIATVVAGENSDRV